MFFSSLKYENDDASVIQKQVFLSHAMLVGMFLPKLSMS